MKTLIIRATKLVFLGLADLLFGMFALSTATEMLASSRIDENLLGIVALGSLPILVILNVCLFRR